MPDEDGDKHIAPGGLKTDTIKPSMSMLYAKNPSLVVSERHKEVASWKHESKLQIYAADMGPEAVQQKESVEAVAARMVAWETQWIEEQKASKEKLQADEAEAKASGLCPCIDTRRKTHTVHVCGRPATINGYCSEHYVSTVLCVSKKAGTGATMRPFARAELPLQYMSAKQHEALRKLPLDTSYEECLRAMNKADPRSRLESLRKDKTND